ncbi:MAG: 30S ribosomal protein S19e [Thermoproteota archaeon]|jgi:small subunit ribosomal protein S19e|nr:30S ribosomal protein S19e [Thermoproteota archaeon]
MAKAYDIPATVLITRLAEQLRNDKKIQPPPWAAYVKTGAHAEKIPQNKDWWYARCASIARKVYIHGPEGVADLKSEYGGRKRIGYYLDHHKDAGGAIIRKALQQLEAAGYVTKKKRGRSISDEGMKKIDRLSTEIYKDIIKAAPELQRYG